MSSAPRREVSAAPVTPSAARRDAFLVTFADAIRPLTSASSITHTSVLLLGRQLDAGQVVYADIDGAGKFALVGKGWNDGTIPNNAGRHLVANFGADITDALKRGDTVVVSDVRRDPRTSRSPVLERFVRASIGAFVHVPILKDGQLAAVLAVHHRTRRAWDPFEVALVQHVAERTSSAVARARKEQELRESEEKYRSLFTSIDEGFTVAELIYDARGKPYDYWILEVNPAQETLTGLKNVVGKRLLDFAPNLEPAWFERIGAVAQTGEPIRFEQYVDDLKSWFDVYAARIGGDGSRLIALVYNNITERKRREANAAFLADLSEAVYALTSPGEIMDTFGHRVSAFIQASSCAFVNVVQAKDEVIITHEWHRRAAHSLLGTYRLSDYLDEVFTTAMAAGQTAVIRDVDNDPRVRDTTRFKALEVGSFVAVPLVRDGAWRFILAIYHEGPYDWREDEVALMREVATRIWNRLERVRAEAALRESEERLRESDRRKDEFIAVLAHELRNPLAPIRTGLELLRLQKDSPAALENIRGMLERQVGHMVRLIDDLLDVSRITSGKIRLQRQRTPLATLVEGAVEANRAAITSGRIDLSLTLPDEAIWLDVDPTRFMQVVSNVLHNAVKFTGANGRISVSAHVEHEHDRGPAHLVLAVSDSGIGISADMLARVFDLFAQDDAHGSHVRGGLGIGLALARRLMQMHGGTIDAHSDGPGKGSVFTMRLPVARRMDDVGTPGADSDPRLSRRVLVIDDNVDAANTTAMLVSALGGDAQTAYDGETGVDTARTFRPDVVLIDIGLPGIDGYETCRRLRSEFGSGVQLIALTGWGQARDKHQAARSGFDAHLTKPADTRLLERLIAGESVA